MAISAESTLSQESLTDSRALSRLREIVNVGNLSTENYAYVMLHKSNSALCFAYSWEGLGLKPLLTNKPF